jgi:hypothetical protein
MKKLLLHFARLMQIDFVLLHFSLYLNRPPATWVHR